MTGAVAGMAARPGAPFSQARLAPLERALEEILCCPACRGRLRWDDSGAGVQCLGCRSIYPLHEDGILILSKQQDQAQREEQAFRDRMAEECASRDTAALLDLVARHHCREIMRARARRFHALLGKGDWLLDVGIRFGWHWLEVDGASTILGIDISLGNLRLASRLLERRADVALVLADAAALPLRDRCIAGLWSVQTFQHLPAPVLASALAEMDRVLRDEFRIEVYNLNPSLGHRIGEGLRRMLGRGRRQFSMNWLSAAQWEQAWRRVRGGTAAVERGYSELFFHPEAGCRPRDYPVRLEQLALKYVPGLPVLVARQSHLHLRPAGTASQEALLRSVYRPPRATPGWRLEELLGNSEARYFSYGRQAFVEALKVAGLRPGDAVALPGLICREVLASLHAVGAEPVFYPVGSDLAPLHPPEQWPAARMIVAVNYFGFPQDLAPFQRYCQRTGAVLLEDNAHGLLSRDEQGRLLGTRGDLGLFSLRKTLPLANGAALVANHGRYALGPQQEFDRSPLPKRYRLKQAMRSLVPVLGARAFSRLLAWTRPTGTQQGATRGTDESQLPSPAGPSSQLAVPLEVDQAEEISRRRALYRTVETLLAGSGLAVVPIHRTLPEQVVPYGYPFYSEAARGDVERVLTSHGLIWSRWPDLPTAVSPGAPPHYKQLHLVHFLW